jgi:hypothetical protein
MPVTHSVRDKIANYVCGLVDAGPGNGKLLMRTSAGATVATLGFNKPAFGSSSGGTAPANTIVPDTNAAGGLIALAVAEDSLGNAVFGCTVSTTGGGGDIQLTATNIVAGQEVSVTSLTYSAPP